MLKIREYVKAESLEQAYELNQKKTNRILGGMLWMKMGDSQIQKAIDLSGLGLDQIEEDSEEFSIGCMVTLRQLEQHSGLNELTSGSMRCSVKDIVGVQFRNLATVGGSIFGRFGFSDVLTEFLALDSYVELYKGGRIPMEEFAKGQPDQDILVRVIVKKKPLRCRYLSHRNTKTDFPVLTCALSVDRERCRLSIGARPGKAQLVPLTDEMTQKLCENSASEEEITAWARDLSTQVQTGSNMRGSAAYRSHLANVLIRRAMIGILEEDR